MILLIYQPFVHFLDKKKQPINNLQNEESVLTETEIDNKLSHIGINMHDNKQWSYQNKIVCKMDT